MSETVLITGIGGQNGSYLLDQLLNTTDCQIVGMLRHVANPNLENIQHNLNNPRFEIEYGDLTDSSSIDRVISKVKPDFVVNFAAQSFVAVSWQIPEATMDINATGVVRLLESIYKYVPNCRFYQAGSSEEFGDVQYSPQDEKHPLRARSPYGASKVAAAQVVKSYRESYNMFAIQGLAFNNESPRRGRQFLTRKVTLGVARIINAIKHNQLFDAIELGNLDAKRDWSHTVDTVNCIWLMLNHTIPKDYVIASGVTHTIREFVTVAFKTAGIDGTWCNDLFESNGKVLVRVSPKLFRPADIEVLCGDSILARTELGWEPKYSFEALVKEMVQYDLSLI